MGKKKSSAGAGRLRNAELWRGTYSEIRDLLADNDETRMSVASRYKAAGEDGLNRGVLKLGVTLMKKTPAQQNDFVQQFTEMCAALGIAKQLELFAKAQPEAEPEEAIVEEEETASASETEGAGARGGFPEDEPSFDQHAIREQGERAAIEGRLREENPFDQDTEEAKEWDGGFTVGEQKQADRVAQAEEGNHNPRRTRGKAQLAVVG